jgi:tRNA 2-thiouridine synthesizing protein E
MSIEVQGKILETDEEGYLSQLSDWSHAAAVAIAAKDGVILGDAHWEVINFLRDYYAQYQIAPAIRVLTKALAKSLGAEKGNTQYLYTLFPSGPAKQACRYAGLPKPTGCI